MASDTIDDGLEIILMPIQLAALLLRESVHRPATLANRFWGALGVIGGAVDLVASIPLWLAPEPSSKVAAAAVDYIGADVAWTGMRQVWTGRRQVTLTAEVVERSLKSLGVDPEVANRIGNGTDIAVNMAALVAPPLAIARSARALRVISVEEGVIDLEIEEGFPGAHTISKHVGKTEPELRTRLAQEPKLTASSSFRTLEDAEKGVSEVIKARAVEIQEWAARPGKAPGRLSSSRTPPSVASASRASVAPVR